MMMMVFSLIFFGIFLWLFYAWWKELKFYKKNNWDFSIDSGLKGIGPGAEGGDPMRDFSPKTRVLFALPIMLVGFLVSSIVFLIASAV